MNIGIYFCVHPDNLPRQMNVMRCIRKLYSEPGFRLVDLHIYWAITEKDKVDDIHKYLSSDMLNQSQVKRFPNKKYCAISHAKIWEEILNSDYEHAVIIEDDAMVKDGFLEYLLQLIEEIHEYDFCFLWYHPDFNRNHSEMYQFVDIAGGAYGNVCYLLSRTGAEKLLSNLPFTHNKDYHIKHLIDEGKILTYSSKKDLVDNLGANDSRDRNSELGSTIFKRKNFISRMYYYFQPRT